MTGTGHWRNVRRTGESNMATYLVNIQESYVIDADDENDALERARAQGRLVDSDAIVWKE